LPSTVRIATGLLVALTSATLALASPAPPSHAADKPARQLLEGDAVVDLLRDYLRIDTSNPPGNELIAARFFKGLFDREGIPSEIFEIAPGRANLVARLKGTGEKRPLVLLNHMDVVNAERPFWSVDPFGGVVKGGYVYGRGALDMKTTGLLEAVVLINLKRSGARLARDLIFVATADEEVDAIGIDWIVKKRPDLVEGAEFMLNEGGVIDRIGGRVRSWDVGVTEKCPLWIKIVSRGRPGHGSQPFTKDNAVLALLSSLDRLSRHRTPIRLTPAAEAYFKARAASQRGSLAEKYRDIRESIEDPEVLESIESDQYLNAIVRNTISITMLQGAPQTNIIPTVAEARVDIRLLPGEDPAAFLEEIRKIVEAPGLTVEPVGPFVPATASPVDSDLMRAIDRARARHHPRAVLAPTILTGWTESAMVRPLGIQAYGFEPFILDGVEQKRAHGNDERISIDNVHLGLRIMDEVVRDVSAPAGSASEERHEAEDDRQDQAQEQARRQRDVEADVPVRPDDVARKPSEAGQAGSQEEHQADRGDQQAGTEEDPAEKSDGVILRHPCILEHRGRPRRSARHGGSGSSG
jgi:acetylornithine deacetylase/succinyl-diaminopimelate desuccinylase-like protein